MFQEHSYARPVVIAEGKDLLEVCRNQEVVRYAIGEQWQMLTPRMRLEKTEFFSQGKPAQKNIWFLECWWRSAPDGVLGYYTKINLETGMMKEFRKLDETAVVPDACISGAGERYLEQCAAVVRDGVAGTTEAEALERLWQEAVSGALYAFAMQKAPEQNVGSYLLPLEALTCWNWEKMKTLMLKRYDTTEEEILDYIAYQASDSEKRYIPLKYREEARKQGLDFWEGEQ